MARVYTRVKCPGCGATIPIIENIEQLGIHARGLDPMHGPPPDDAQLCEFSFRALGDLETELEVVEPGRMF